MSIPSKIVAMAAKEKGAAVEKYEYTPKPLAQNDVDIHVLYNGLCATDVHMIDNDWGISAYPLVPGHEICGEVVGVGSAVTKFKPGDKVALGCLAQSCMKCEFCAGGERDIMCPDRVMTYMGSTKDETGEHQHYGGFSSFLRTDGRFLFKVPEGYPLEYVGPLMCAGATVTSPMYEYCGNSFNAKGKTFGIVGLGGLGHLAVMFASKMGAKTIAISRGETKKPFAADLGASVFLNSQDQAAMAAAANTIDFLLICTSGGSFDIMPYTELMRPCGTIQFVGVPNEPLTFPIMPLIFKKISLGGSLVASSTQLQAMLTFAASNNIKPIIEVFPHSQANDAIKKVKDNTIRFRAVLKNDLA